MAVIDGLLWGRSLVLLLVVVSLTVVVMVRMFCGRALMLHMMVIRR